MVTGLRGVLIGYSSARWQLPVKFPVDHQQLFSSCFRCLGNLISSCAGQEATSNRGESGRGETVITFCKNVLTN